MTFGFGRRSARAFLPPTTATSTRRRGGGDATNDQQPRAPVASADLLPVVISADVIITFFFPALYSGICEGGKERKEAACFAG